VLGMLKAMRQTIGHLGQRKITVQYPDEREQLAERSRGVFRVVVDPTSDDARCRACTLCETNCPVQVIRVNYTSKYKLPVPNQARISATRLDSQPAVDLTLLDPILAGFMGDRVGMIGVLQHTQEEYGYLPRAALHAIALRTGTPLSQIYGVVSFYNQFRLSPVGKYLITVCHGTACHVAGAPLVTAAFSEELDIPLNGTTKDRLFTLQAVNCVGACALAPVVRVGDDDTYGRVTPDSARKLVHDLRAQEGLE
jgi:NADH-quinone oxidoreductase subunit E